MSEHLSSYSVCYLMCRVIQQSRLKLSHVFIFQCVSTGSFQENCIFQQGLRKSFQKKKAQFHRDSQYGRQFIFLVSIFALIDFFFGNRVKLFLFNVPLESKHIILSKIERRKSLRETRIVILKMCERLKKLPRRLY